MQKILFLLCLYFIGATSFLGAQTRFVYKLRYAPVNEQNCQVTAQSVAARFTAVTQRQVISAYCERDMSNAIAMVITYGGDYELNLVSTTEEFLSDQGVYASLQECESVKNLETQKFKQYTALEPIAAYCFSTYKSVGDNPHPFALRIDAFGTPKLWPITKKWGFFNKPDLSENLIAATVKERALQLGIVDPQIVFDYTFSTYRLLMKYYSPTKMSLPLSTIQFATYETLQECQARRNEVNNILSNAEAIPLITLCTVDKFSYLAPMSSLIFTRGAYGSEMVGGTYETMAVCDQDRERVTALYRATFGSDVIGAVCSHQNGRASTRAGAYMRMFYRL